MSVRWNLLQHQQNFILYFGRQLNATCLQAVHPQVNLLALHGVEHLAELFDFFVSVCSLLPAFEPVQFLVIKIKVVIALVTYGVLAATYAVYRGVVMMFFGYGAVLAELLEQQETCH